MKYDLYTPTNWHRPNPIAALPSYATRNRKIVFLTPDEVEEQLAVLANHAAIRMAAEITIYAGLRRAETLWLTRDSIAKDLSYLSVLHRRDDENDIESSLKTGERTVTIHPFSDFNGRTIRLFLRELLRRLDFPRVILEPDTDAGRTTYFAALEAADRRDLRPLVAIWRDRLTHAETPEA